MSEAAAWLWVRLFVGTVWGGVLFVSGMAVVDRGDEFPAARWACTLGGSGLAAAGLFVFTCVVADRVFPRADQRLCAWVQSLLAAVFVGGCGYAVYWYASTAAAA